MASRYLGVDPGTKRIGLAVGDAGGGVVSPVRVIEAGSAVEANARAIVEVAVEYGADGIVIGLPLNMDGTRGPQAKRSEALAERIRELVRPDAGGAEDGCSPVGEAPAGRFEVYLHDERLTSHAADQRLTARNLTRGGKRSRQDAIAAQILLESFLESRG